MAVVFGATYTASMVRFRRASSPGTPKGRPGVTPAFAEARPWERATNFQNRGTGCSEPIRPCKCAGLFQHHRRQLPVAITA